MKTIRLRQGVLILVVAALAAAAGAWWGQREAARPHPAGAEPAGRTQHAVDATAERKPLYWYDPMFPQQHFPAPGKSPFMDMQLVPRYADDDAATNVPAVAVDAATAQKLGLRLATVARGADSARLAASGVLAFNAREVAIVQARQAGFVERVYARAPGDVIRAGAPLADVLVPEWVGAQQEFLALLAMNDPGLIEAGRSRLRVSGMPEALIRRIEKSRRAEATSTITAPLGGVIQSLDVRPGMTLAPGQTLARINGLGTVWIEVAVPEAQAGGLRAGQRVSAVLPAYPGETFAGRLSAILPEASLETRSVRVRVELPNRDGRLRPGLTAEVEIDTGASRSVLRVPSEALIRTGKRTLAMLAESGGRYRPVEVKIGAEHGGYTEILDGLHEGQQIVSSGQFLLDSEASLAGITAPPLGAAASATPAEPAAGKSPPRAPAPPPLHSAEGRIVELSKTAVTIAHGPFTTLNMPGMTMGFALARPGLAQSLKVGDRVRFAVRESDDGLVIERIQKIGAAR